MGMTPTAAPSTDRWATVAGWLGPLALGNLLANIGIVVTGGAVRLTGSGLGCPTWPRCSESSYVPHGELGLHGAIEFGNRLLTFVLAAVAIACWVAAIARRRVDITSGRSLRLSTIVLLGVPAQALIGGITVLTDLNPWIVAGHLLVSMAMIGVCVALVDDIAPRPRIAAPTHLARLVTATFAAAWLVLYLGTVVTGSGPHSGDLDSRRTGLDSQLMSHVHAFAVYLLLALTLAVVLVARRSGSAAVYRSARLLLALELAQGVIGFVQYWTDLPELLVGLHLLGAALVSAGATRILLDTRAASSRGDDGAVPAAAGPAHGLLR